MDADTKKNLTEQSTWKRIAYMVLFVITFNLAEAVLAAARDGEHYRTEGLQAGLDLLLEAARGGSLQAQYRYGALQFGLNYLNESPRPGDEEVYVGAFTWLGVADRRGHPEARTTLPPLVQDALAGRAPVPDAIGEDEPLADVPLPWIRRAAEEAARLASCYPGTSL